MISAGGIEAALGLEYSFLAFSIFQCFRLQDFPRFLDIFESDFKSFFRPLVLSERRPGLRRRVRDCFCPWSIFRLSRVVSSLRCRRDVFQYVYGARLFSWHFLDWSLSPPFPLFFDNVWSLPVFFFLLFRPLVLSEIVRSATASSRCFCPWSIFRLSRVVSSLRCRRVVFQYVYGARLFSWHFLDWSLSPPFPLFFDNVWSLPVFFFFSSGRSSCQRSSGLRRGVRDAFVLGPSFASPVSCPLFCSAGSSSRTFLELDYFHGTFWTGRFPLHSPCFLTMSGLSLSFFSSLPAARLVREKVRPETASLRCFSPWSILRLSRVLSSLLFRRVVCHYVYGARLFSWHFLNASLSPPLALVFDNVWSLPVFFFSSLPAARLVRDRPA